MRMQGYWQKVMHPAYVSLIDEVSVRLVQQNEYPFANV